ncbi:mechanosensitive ion channel [Aurantimonas sp. MSK8Z-1]|uniref:mechanosensitive ion channel family protein n=1 Tax=Mangrovibrevibacter kandeliae TaxID=2968473 RepID=UPI00211866EB|nr:mechanosensitive ion channel domain-containing protein [Aurantimonas sp. MSK8Z-1]MCW4114715.1 mechanosensitive ion channel [Aurantimonas sp. MSK8Z-1]
MNEGEVRAFGRYVAGQFENLLAYFRHPDSLLRIAIIVGAFFIAWLIARLAGPALEGEARRIKGAPNLLRVVVALLRRLRLAFFVLLMWGVTLIDRASHGPASQLFSVVFSLALAYLVIAVASRALRNRLLARTVTYICWGIAALSILNLLDPVAGVLDQAAINVGTSRISALLVLKAIAVVAVSLWIANALGRFLDNRIKRSEELTPTLRVLIGKLLKIGLVVIGLAVALAAVGVDLTAFTVLSGAVGVGLGFGLQKVVSNFISGIIILLDRSIKPGDTITVGETFGWIRELHARYVSVGTRDGKEYLIPNEDFITERVVNWSFASDFVRIDVTFGVSYESDPHEVIRIAKEAAVKPARVLQEKGAVCWMTGFGESSLDFILRFWIKDPPAGIANVKGEVLLALWDALKANRIEIPYPHREVVVRPAWPEPSGGPVGRAVEETTGAAIVNGRSDDKGPPVRA